MPPPFGLSSGMEGRLITHSEASAVHLLEPEVASAYAVQFSQRLIDAVLHTKGLMWRL